MPPARSRLRVLVVDDTELGADLAAAIERDPELDCVARATALDAGVRAARDGQPDVVLLRTLVGRSPGLDWIARIAATAPQSRILVLSEVTSELLAQESLRRGAAGFLVHHGNVEALLGRVRASAGRPRGDVPVELVAR